MLARYSGDDNEYDNNGDPCISLIDIHESVPEESDLGKQAVNPSSKSQLRQLRQIRKSPIQDIQVFSISARKHVFRGMEIEHSRVRK